jgi:hypothetical protein
MRDFRTETIAAVAGRAANATRNWRDGLRVYSGAPSSTAWGSGPQADAVAKLLVAAVAFSSASRK